MVSFFRGFVGRGAGVGWGSTLLCRVGCNKTRLLNPNYLIVAFKKYISKMSVRQKLINLSLDLSKLTHFGFERVSLIDLMDKIN